MKTIPALLLSFGLSLSLRASSDVVVKVVNASGIARPAETISVAWPKIAQHLPGLVAQKLVVKDGAGHALPYQVIDASGELIFQHDFTAGEKTATFTINLSDEPAMATPFPARVFCRSVPERLDDFAWENDKVGHRAYGPALAAPAPAGSHKEVMTSSGIDIWCKRVSSLVVDRWYSRGDYHADHGEGMDMYAVGTSRGWGGTGVWDGSHLAVSANYQHWKVFANGPIRAVFELSYAPWTAGDRQVSETKRITVDAGHNLDLIESTFEIVGGKTEALRIGVGLEKNPANAKQNAQSSYSQNASEATEVQWVKERTNGELGTAIVMERSAFAGYAEDELNVLVLARATSGKPLRYLAGAGWSRAGEFTTEAKWNAYVAACAERFRVPIEVTVER